MFFESTIMGKTADLAMVQKTIIDTLHKEEAHNQLPRPPPPYRKRTELWHHYVYRTEPWILWTVTPVIIYGFHFLKWVTKNIDLFHIQFFLDVVKLVVTNERHLHRHSLSKHNGLILIGLAGRVLSWSLSYLHEGNTLLLVSCLSVLWNALMCTYGTDIHMPWAAPHRWGVDQGPRPLLVWWCWFRRSPPAQFEG